MKGKLIVFCVIATLCISKVSELDFEQEFSIFKAKFNKKYQAEEHKYRMHVFTENLNYIQSVNSQDLPFKLGVGPHADLTYKEFSSKYLMPSRLTTTEEFEEHIFTLSTEGLPEYLNWLDSGNVTSVKNQGECGASYIFAALDAVESARSILFEETPETLSPQQVLDCEDDTEGNGCGGGDGYLVYDYLVDTDCIADIENYPYVGKETKCNNRNGERHCTDGFVSDWKAILPNNELQLQAGVTRQPLNARIYLGPNLQHYRSGLMSSDSCGSGESSNYEVLLTGYGQFDEPGSYYWIAKASLGIEWGIGGYLLISRDPTNVSSPGSCSVASQASFPLVL